MVEDEKDIADLMSLHLRRDGIEVEVAENGEQAFALLGQQNFSFLILDWMLPGISGLDICKKIRSENGPLQAIPILLVTARAQTADIVLGLEMGADDYITKPFDISVFLARVRALLRRATSSAETQSNAIIQIGKLTVNTERHEVKCNNQVVELTPSEFKLLLAMMKNRGRVLTRERLIELVQGEGVTVIDRAIDTHIFGLRKKIGDCANLVETIRGVGYRVADTLD
ncbi:MAG: DNA-binding response regulator [Proteobacteria bacterium]|nr:DNA-binding response regulator [Pseudomonadota bacterium]